MRHNQQTKGDEMTTKLIGLAVTVSLGYIVVTKVMGLFAHVTAELQTITIG